MLHPLPNGITLLAAPMPHLASASVAIFIRAGSRDESADKAGVSHFLEHMAFKGTHTRTVQALNFAAESLGADMNAYTDKDATCYHLEGLGTHVPQMLALLADIVLQGTFPADELERERDVILQECIEYEEDPQHLAFTLLDEALWGTHAMGRPIIGTPGTIATLTREDIVGHVRRHYVGERIVVAAAGRFDVDAFLAQAQALFGGVRSAGTQTAPQPPGHVGSAKARRLPGVSQTYIDIAWTVPSRGEHPYLADLAATLFGGGMSAPLVDA
ncbi:MAG: pitrilysin family protein, partial [Ramlibacter sp.]